MTHHRHHHERKHHHVTHHHAHPHHHSHHPHHAHHGHAHHHHRHHHHHNGIGEASKRAYHTVGRDIVKPFWDDLVKPVVALPGQALNVADDGVRTFSNPTFLIVAGGIAAILLLRK